MVQIWTTLASLHQDGRTVLIDQDASISDMQRNALFGRRVQGRQEALMDNPMRVYCQNVLTGAAWHQPLLNVSRCQELSHHLDVLHSPTTLCSNAYLLASSCVSMIKSGAWTFSS